MATQLTHCASFGKSRFTYHGMVAGCAVRNTFRMAANELKALRKNRGLRQREVAERLGVSEAQISRWENGKNNIPSGQLADFATAYECSISDIFSAGGGVAAPALPSEVTLVEMLRAVAPFLSGGQASEELLVNLAHKLAVASRAVAETPDIEHDEKELRMLLRGVFLDTERSPRDKSSSGSRTASRTGRTS